MKKTRILSLLLVVSMLIGLCSFATADEDVTEIVLLMSALGSVPTGLQEVVDAVNEISVAEIGVKVDIQMIPGGSYYDQQVSLMIAGGEQIDLLVTMPGGSVSFSNMYANGQLMDVTDILDEYGQGLLEEMDKIADNLILGTTVNGRVYGVTVLYNKVLNNYWLVRGDIVEKYDINLDEVKSLADITEILAFIQENEPDLIGVSPPTYNTPNFFEQTASFFVTPDENFDVVYYDSLGDNYSLGIAFLDDYGKIVGYADQELYAQSVQQGYDWYTEGYVYKDAAFVTEMAEVLAGTGNLFSWFSQSETGVEASKTAQIGYPIKAVKLGSGVISTSALTKFDWVFPVTSKEPEAAMEFLSLWAGSAELSNLLAWGIEGRDYVIEDGIAKYPEGVTAETVAFHNADFTTGNQFLTTPWEGNPANLREITLRENQEAAVSPLLGFIFDYTDVSLELAALNNVINEYRPTLACGSADPAVYLPKYLEALDDAGLDIVLAKMQEQLDAFLGQ